MSNLVPRGAVATAMRPLPGKGEKGNNGIAFKVLNAIILH